MLKPVTSTRLPMCPLDNVVKLPVLASFEVITLTLPGIAAVMAPIVKPVSVTVAAVDAATVPLCTVNTIELEVCDVSVAVAPPLMATEGDGDDRKKLAG